MNTDVLERMDNLVSQAGTSNSYELAGYLNAHIGDITSPKLLAFVVRRSGIVCIGLNPHLPDHIKEVILMHEVAHVAFHLDFFDNQGFFHGESSFQLLKNQTITIQEYEANLVAADFCLPTDDILEMLGFNNNAMKEYRRYMEKFKKHRQEYEYFMGSTIFTTQSEWTRKRLLQLKKQMIYWQNVLEEMQHDLTFEGDFMSVDEISREFEVPKTIIEYKLEALRHRGYDIDELELTSCNKVFM
ncbi:MAG: ImmA/IrrE family metallo-endopeptidase [Selenomonadaceae bacterium]|nr:ImmA/IrrE family metallo-endopeptidase [Selenomonadaceae bacterium]MBO6305233.1 ImmA/IrrE family metallo-endopeptidase [Selenomonadaceae bacterium]